MITFNYTTTDLHTRQTKEELVEFASVEAAEKVLEEIFYTYEEAFNITTTQQANGAFVIGIKSYIKEPDPEGTGLVKVVRLTHQLKSIN